MLAPLLFVFFVGLASVARAQIGKDLNCTKNDGTDDVYTDRALICSNTQKDAVCEVLYPKNPDYPTVGGKEARPSNCFSKDGTELDQDMQKTAAATCAKTCGLCCITDAYKCDDAKFPRIKCSGVTNAQCQSPEWRTIIASDCPSACGFCNEGGCVDSVVECANDRSICTTVGMQDFVNQYCQKTCDRCASTTAANSNGGAVTTPSSGGGSCTSYQADSSTACASWATNGFCTNTFYTLAQRKAYCARTCRIC
uniref:ShKT domain-containing protein n=1 Tax=Caenorhabditis japonica TaxID=281687 RepID=A0A8R1E4C4_CAEJA